MGRASYHKGRAVGGMEDVAVCFFFWGKYLAMINKQKGVYFEAL
jgi:hypothetical protein